MRIRFLVSLSGPEVNFQPGDIADVENEEAGRLIEAGIAIPDAAGPAVERRNGEDVETPTKKERR